MGSVVRMGKGERRKRKKNSTRRTYGEGSDGGVNEHDDASLISQLVDGGDYELAGPNESLGSRKLHRGRLPHREYLCQRTLGPPPYLWLDLRKQI